MSWLLSWGDCQHDWSPHTASGKGFCLYFRQTVLLHYIWSLQLLPLSASALNIVRMFLALTLVSFPSFMLPLQVPHTGSRSDKSVQMHHCSAGLGSEAAECAWDMALHSQPCWGCWGCLGAEQKFWSRAVPLKASHKYTRLMLTRLH